MMEESTMKSCLFALVSSAFAFGGCNSEPAREAPPRTAADTRPPPMPATPTPRDAAPLGNAAPSTTPVAGPELAAPTAGKTENKTPDVIYVPTPQPVVDKMLELAKIKKNDLVYDLGCGDGRIVITAAKKFGVKAVGFDVDPLRVAEAREKVRENGVEELVTIEQRDIFTLDLSPASVVTLYLLPALNVRLIPQLEKLKPGSRIVSHDFDMEGVKPQKHLTLDVEGESRGHEVYLWTTPLNKTPGTADKADKAAR
jgi:SAM-dependent methyltransferase